MRGRLIARQLSGAPPKLVAVIELATVIPGTIELPNPISVFCGGKRLPPQVEGQNLIDHLLALPKEFQRDVLGRLYHRCRPDEAQRLWWEGMRQVFSDPELRFHDDIEDELISVALSLITSAAKDNQYLVSSRMKDFAEVRHNESLDVLLHDALSSPSLLCGLIDLAELYSFVWRTRDALRKICGDDLTCPSGRFFADKDGLIQIQKDALDDAIEGIEKSKLRQCGICRQVFWVRRVDQFCCTSRCNHIRHSRVTRRKKTNDRETKKANVDQVRPAIDGVADSVEKISVNTKLPLGEVTKIVSELSDSGQLDWDVKNRTLYVTKRGKKGK
jgi:hypothetical protein